VDLVGGGQAKASSTERAESSVMPKGATWIRTAAASLDPQNNTVTCTDGTSYEYDVLVVCPGIQLDWNRTEGLQDALGRDGVSSNYRFDLAPRTWDLIRTLRSGTAVFTIPSGAIKCAGAPQKIAYLAADYWRKQGVLNDIDVHLVMPGARPFGIPAIADSLDKVIADYGITLHTNSEVTSVDAASRKVGVTSVTSVAAGGTDTTLPYDVLHAVPRQSAPDWIKSSPLSTGDANGYVDIDKHTMQHVRYPNVFSLVTQAHRRTPRPVPRSASRPLWLWRTSTRSWPAGQCAPAMTVTRPARSSPRRTRCYWPSSTTT